MKAIDEPKLESELGYRFEYLAEFMGFGEADIKAIHAAASALAPLVPGLVDAVYAKLHTYSSTWRHFLPRQHGYSGEVPADLEHLTEAKQCRLAHGACHGSASLAGDRDDDVVAALRADLGPSDAKRVDSLPDDRDGLVERALADVLAVQRGRGQRHLGTAAKVKTEGRREGRPGDHPQVEGDDDDCYAQQRPARPLLGGLCHESVCLSKFGSSAVVLGFG